MLEILGFGETGKRVGCFCYEEEGFVSREELFL